MKMSELKPLGAKVTLSESDIQSAKDNPILLRNLEIGVKIANEVRKTLPESYTHPQANNYPPEIFESIIHDIDNLRRKIYTECNDLENSQEDKIKMLEIESSILRKAHMGNCNEYAALGLKILREKYPDIHGEVEHLLLGGHYFLIIDPCVERFGKNAVIMDAWSGSVFPASEINTRLGAFIFKKIGPNEFDTINVVTNFNPVIHKLEPHFDIECDVRRPRLI
jgi:hypothetical protein